MAAPKVGGEPKISPPQFRRMLIETLDDPAFARALARRLLLPTFPIQGGLCGGPAASEITAGSFSCGAYTFAANAAGVVPLSAKGFASQTADLQQWQDSAGTVLAEVTASGKVGIGTSSPGAKLHVEQTGGGELARFKETSYGGLSIYLGDAVGGIQGITNALAAGTLVLNRGGGKVGIGEISPQGLQHNKIASRSTAFDPASGTTWHDLIVQNPNNTQNAAVGLAFELNSGYHTNAGTGIAAVKSVASSDYAADLAFVTRPDQAVAAERMRIKSDGKVGIGTTSPQAKLHVSSGNISSDFYDTAAVETTGNTDFNIIAGGSSIATLNFGDTDGNVGKIEYSNDSNSMRFFTNTAERMRIKSDGKVGIGTDSPIRPLHVKGGDIVVEGDPDAGGGLAVMKPGGSAVTSVIYRAGGSAEGQDYTVLRTYRNESYHPDKIYTALKIWAPPDAIVNDREATLALVRGDSDQEFMDVYNNGYSSETQYGIRIGKNTGGQFRDFVFDLWDRTANPETKTTLMILKTDGKIGIGTPSPAEKLTVAAGEIGLEEISDPAAPAANRARLYVRDNGSGKMQLVVRFGTGDVQVLATEP